MRLLGYGLGLLCLQPVSFLASFSCVDVSALVSGGGNENLSAAAMSFSHYLKVPFDLVPDFNALLGYEARHGTDDTTAHFVVHDKAISDALELYLGFPGGYSDMSPRKWLENHGFDAQRLDALKKP